LNSGWLLLKKRIVIVYPTCQSLGQIFYRHFRQIQSREHIVIIIATTTATTTTAATICVVVSVAVAVPIAAVVVGFSNGFSH